MNSLICNIDGKGYVLGQDNNVVDSNGIRAGQWKSAQTDPSTNALVLSTADGDNIVPARYSFNSNNQLSVLLQNTNGDWTDSQVLNGRLLLVANQNIGYQFVDENGNDQPASITLYGVLHLDGNDDLSIRFPDGNVAVIDAQQVNHDQNAGTGAGDDVLRIAATTYNYDGQLMQAADLALPGRFKPAAEGLVFEINGNEAINLTFNETFRGTSVGLEYHHADVSDSVVFTASSKYRWDSGQAAWMVYLGNSAKGFVAAGAFNASTALGNGRFQLSGTFDFSPSNSNLNMALSLSVTQKWDVNNAIVFNVEASTDNGVTSYDLGIEGTAKLLGGQLTFDLKTGSANSFEIALGWTGQGLVKAINFTFDRSDTGVSAGLTLQIQMSWQNGTRVKGQPSTGETRALATGAIAAAAEAAAVT